LDPRKLRLGSHAGNRFELFLEGLPAERLPDLKAILTEIQERGLPNEFGPQRYGHARINAALGQCLQRGAIQEFLQLWGSVGHLGDYPQAPAFTHWLASGSRPAWDELREEPRRLPPALRSRLSHVQADAPESLLESIPKGDKQFFLSAMQSELFDDWVRLRRELDAFDGAPQVGDCLGQPRLRDQPIATGDEPSFPKGDAPLGPMFGPSMNQSQARAREIERLVLERAGLSEETFQEKGPDRARGTRRPLFATVSDVEVRTVVGASAGGCWLSFTLPPGAYATTVLAQLSKDFLIDPKGEER